MWRRDPLIVFSNTGGDAPGAAIVGGKGANLLRLQKLGFPVPRFVILTIQVFDRATRPVRGQINALLSDLSVDDRERIEAASRSISALIEACAIPDSAHRPLGRILETRLGGVLQFAVRSSVGDEDSHEHSFAGQMDSFLCVGRDEVYSTVRRVWASAYSPRVLLYRLCKGLPVQGVETAVIIQEMAHGTSSGVMFTRGPGSDRHSVVISAGLGLGEGVVQDQVETDTCRIDRATLDITYNTASKNLRVVPEYGGQGTRLESVPQLLRETPVLSDGQIRELASAGTRLESAFGCPQDVEWVYDAEGRLFILQARPIVETAPAEQAGTRRIWDNSNIVESYPGLTLPLTFSFVRQCYAFSLRRAVTGFLLRRREIEAEGHMFDHMIGLLDGRVYYNLHNWYRMYSYLPGFQKHKRAWDRMVGIRHPQTFEARTLSRLNRMFAAAAAAFRLLTVRRTARIFERCFSRNYGRYRGVDFARMSGDALRAHYEAMKRDFARFWHLTLYNDFCAMKYYEWQRTLCRCPELRRFKNLHNDLLAGDGGVESTRPIFRLLEIGRMTGADPAGRALFEDSNDARVWHRIREQPRFESLRCALDEYLDLYGDRATEELKLDRPSLRERPEELIGLLRPYLREGVSDENLGRREVHARARAEATIRSHLRNPVRRALFTFVLRRARIAVAQRENMRFARSRLFGIVRRLFARMGHVFVETGLLDETSHLHYLTVEEIFAHLEGAAATRDLRALVALRRREYEAYDSRTPAERLETTGSPYAGSLGEEPGSEAPAKRLQGTGCSTGVSRGRASIVSDPSRAGGAGDFILVAKSTDPGWIFLMIRSRGIVVEKGSVLSHTAIVGRELGIPTVVGVRDATRRIRDGGAIRLNGATGEVRCE